MQGTKKEDDVWIPLSAMKRISEIHLSPIPVASSNHVQIKESVKVATPASEAKNLSSSDASATMAAIVQEKEDTVIATPFIVSDEVESLS
jgi:F420-0:gamma-glutamyl ligase-like protein